MMANMCGDNRFEIIEKAKKDLLESTNIQTSEDEMQVIDNILFRCWQMGWLEKYKQPKTNADRIRNMTDEELADILIDFCACDVCEHHTEYNEYESCSFGNVCVEEYAKAITQKWLQTEVEEEN